MGRNSPKPEVRRDVPEMTDDLSPLRFVIQQLGVFAVPGYRIVVYGDEFKPRHCDFDSAAVLLGTWRSSTRTRSLAAIAESNAGRTRFHRLRGRDAPQRKTTIDTRVEIKPPGQIHAASRRKVLGSL